jgi:hypothetical protein
VVPNAILAPYFVNDGTEAWIDANKQLIAATAQRVGDATAAILAYESELVAGAELELLADSYQEAPFRSCFLWPGDLDEHFASQDALSAYADLVTTLAEIGKRPTAAYGGFFAMLLAFRGLAGVCHGVGYGDKRNVEPVVGGGLPPARYYLRAKRDGISIGELPIVAEGLTDEQFGELICNCTICNGLLATGGIPALLGAFAETETRVTPVRGLVDVSTSRVYRMTRFHFLENRHREILEVDSADSFGVLQARLAADAAWLADRLGRRSVAHIYRWIAAADPERPPLA